MKTRPILRLATTGLVIFAVAATLTSQQQDAVERRVVITIDDLPAICTCSATDPGAWSAITEGLLQALRQHQAPAIGFVNEGKLFASASSTDPEPERVALLESWLEAGHELGNHGRSHLDLHRVPLAQYVRDFERGDEVLGELLAARDKRPRYFRHPFLRAGRSLEIKAELGQALARHGYRIAPVTIDNAEYLFARAYDLSLDRGEAGEAERVVGAYLAYMQDITAYYEEQSTRILGYELPQVLLIHANRLNAAALGPLLESFSQRGYRFITLDEALQDPAYERPDEYTGPAGITWLHRWALADGHRGDFFWGEPEVPHFVREILERD